MSILVTADLHLSNNPRDAYRHAWQKWLRTYVRNHDVDLVIILGDICEAKDQHPAPLVNAVVDHLHRLSRLAPVVILMGNHDYVSPDSPYFAFVARLEHLSWVGAITLTPAPKNLPVAASGLSAPPLKALGRVLWLPHSPDWARDWQAADDEGYLKAADWVFAHQCFNGAKVGPRTLEGARTDIFGPRTKIIAGDIHNPQTVGPVTYVGAPYRVDFGDNYDPRMLLIKNGKLISIPTEGPQKQLVEVKSLKELRQHEGRLNTGDIVKVRVILGDGDYARWGKIQDEVRVWGESNGLYIYMVQPIVITDPAARKRKGEFAPRSDTELVKAYAKQNKIDDRTLKIGLELLK